MAIITSRDDIDTRQFYLLLYQYEDHVLRKTYVYFQDDLQHIVENLSPYSLLSELHFRGVPHVVKYQSLKINTRTLARTLLQDIFNRGREAVIALWVSLHVLQRLYGSPGLRAVLEELQRGNNLAEEIMLDKHGHHLPPKLKNVQNCHKKYLYEKTENLIENKPPRCNQEEESFPFCTRYVNLIIVSTDHVGKRSVNELIETGEKHEEYLKKTYNELEHIFPNKLFRWCHQSGLMPRIVMVSGVPGVGKTTLMQKFVYDWVRGDLYQRFSFVFFKFRELNRLNEVSLETMILQQYPYLEEQIENILQDPEKLLFIFDGLDESNHTMDFTSYNLCSNPRERGHCGQIVVSLVRKSLLDGCSVLMTSRPTRLASIDCKVFQRIVEITGFLLEERRTYFENFSDPELAEKAFSYVKQNDTLYTFCYLPSYCWIICTVISRSFQTTRGDQPASLLPKTVTQLFAIFIANILANHSLDKSDAQKILQSIGWMAEHGVMNHRVIFDDRDLDSFLVDNKSRLLSSFLMGLDEPGTYSFLHLTVQEFFSALVHFIDYSPEKLWESLNRAKSYPDGRGEIFLRFLCGLSDASTRSMLTGYLDRHVAAQASIDVITWLTNLIPEEQGLEKTKEKKQSLLRTFFYLFETRNKALVRELLQSHRGFDFSGIHMSALDCTMLAFILDTCSNIEELDISGCALETEGLEKLAAELRKLWFLRLAHNNLPDTSCTQLASVIRNNQSLRILDLSNNCLYGPHFSNLIDALSSPVCRIEALQLAHNLLPDTSCTQLASVLRNNRSLKKLDLTGNHLYGPHFSDMMEALSNPICRIEELHLADNNLPDTSCSLLASVIRNNWSLKRLVLSGNRLSGPLFGDMMDALSSPICRIEELYLAHNNLQDTYYFQLASVIRNNQSLKRLDLSYNDLSDLCLRILMQARFSPASRIEELDVKGNELSEIAEEILRQLESYKPNVKILYSTNKKPNFYRTSGVRL
ncbi:NACHT, LRR and PYD domains-containing protein 12-like [Dendropsophus ebraccatus]|uniref:NACHT, LRR and PYD domains-containing protein 12-like n=1 Tax=Dendropsophus ebraccatus TaxID=150705 RepID=UPI0038318C7D